MNKSQIIQALKETRTEFLELIESLPEQSLVEERVVGSWTMRDVIMHISLWEAELIKSLWQIQQGQKPPNIELTDKDVEKKNAQWSQENRDRPIDLALADFEAVRSQTLKRLDAFTDKDLTDPRRYPWMKGTPLWKWVAGDTFKHEQEHIAQIKAWKAGKGL